MKRSILPIGFLFCLAFQLVGCSNALREDALFSRGLSIPRLQAQPQEGALALSWSWFSYDFSQPTPSLEPETFVLFVSQQPGGPFEPVDTVPGNTSTYTLIGLEDGNSYFLYLQAEAAEASPAISKTIMAQPGPVYGLMSLPGDARLRTWGSWSPDGSAVVYMRSQEPTSASNAPTEAEWEVVTRDLSGGAETPLSQGAAPAWHPQGEAIVFQTRWFETQAPDSAGPNQLGVYRPATGQVEALFDSLPGARYAPAWSPDGQLLAYFSNERIATEYQVVIRPFTNGLFSSYRDFGPGIPDPGAAYGLSQRPGPLSWAPDGSKLFFDRPEAQNGVYLRALYTLDLASFTEQALLPSEWNDAFPAVAPGGQQLAFLSDRSGRVSLWSLELASGKLTQVVLPDGYRLPLTRNRLAWNPSGQQLLLTVVNPNGQETIGIVDR